ncbi:PP2C family protein-serine/threonine phosphatase [Erythrobacter mangrovi]|uniref:Serine/threonine-protein phosphatase n=1 Tax=Erythrobacter mangrovi TaxID=2739433 RepID=A0A7D3XDV8_9SPHN|nr:protein phosphatase 2C domain-containing protein [Erythrobacter mangrovi]QKG72580.1 serine/threonine-protein phosphatase [Erythrobacter mangrovi]
MRFHSASRTDVGLKRKLNEDALLDRADRSIWVVADGMGGHESGEVASAMVVEAIEQSVTEIELGPALRQVEEALQQANSAMVEMMAGDRLRKMGSTAVGLVVADDGRYFCFWVGDSRAYHIRGGQITQITRDHSLVQKLIDNRLISPEDAAHHPDANVITRAVGADKVLEIDHVVEIAQPNDIFVLASDGLTRCVEAEEICKTVTSGNPAQACEELVETVLSRGAPDNVSVVVVRVC